MNKWLEVLQDENNQLVVAFADRSAAEFGIAIADIFKHFENARGREFSASVFAMFYKELAHPTSGTTRLK